jgi:hypothetical protein
LKTLCDADAETKRLRDDLHAQGVTTGSIPYAEINNIEDIARRFCAWVERNFPEVRM